MNRLAFVCTAFLLAGCIGGYARTAHTGHLIVTLTDRETGEPITNATVVVRTQTEFNPDRTLESYFTKTSAMPDTNGVADVEFQFYEPRYNWWVDAPSHYSRKFGFGSGEEEMNCTVVESDYLDIDTNTVAGLEKYNELMGLYNSGDYMAYAAKFEPKSVTFDHTVIHRSVCLTPKHNPQPMCAHGGRTQLYLPMKNPAMIITNDLEIAHYKPVDIDLVECLIVRPIINPRRRFANEVGKVSDFHLERFSVTTNGVETQYGWIEFAPGCGAYITKEPDIREGRFPVIYEADTNAVFLSRIPFECSYVNGRAVYEDKLIKGDECMVLRTRAVTNDVGDVTSCNYSKIYGPLNAFRVLEFGSLIFNPRPNDPNLEYDLEHNLAPRGETCYRP